MNILRRSFFGLLILPLLLTGCKDDDPVFNEAKQFEKEVAAIDAYLDGNSITHIKDMSGIRMVITTLGTKLPAQSLSTIDVTYAGRLFSDGTQFEAGTALGFVTDFIAGWQIALRKLPVGSVATIYIPSYYAYGNTKKSTIPANSTLVFDITVNSATQSAVFTNKFKSDTAVINAYLANKGVETVRHASGVKYAHLVEGTGATPSWFSKVKLKYTFTLLSDDSKSVGTYEREPYDQFNSFVVDYIQGVQVGLQQMKVGGKLRAYVPSGLAFGIENAVDGSGNTIVPANSNVIVDIELIEIK